MYSNRDTFFWDFKVYYGAVKHYAAGHNPYEYQARGVADQFIYLYPPLTMWFFMPFMYFKLSKAAGLYFLFKAALFGGLVYSWRRFFLGGIGGSLYYIFCATAYNNAVSSDLKSGNISMVEQALLWAAFFFFIRGNPGYVCVFVVAAAYFKLLPLAFAGLLLFMDDRRKYVYFAAAIVGFFALHLLSYAIYPDFYAGYLRNVMIMKKEGGIVNPSSLSLISFATGLVFERLDALGAGVSTRTAATITNAVYAVVALLVAFAALKTYFKIKDADAEQKKLFVLFVFCMVYGITAPRFKDYSFILLIAPTYYMITKLRFKEGQYLLFIPGMFSVSHTIAMLPLLKHLYFVAWQYYALLFAGLVLGLYLWQTYHYGLDREAPERIIQR
jgi:hypothetical protein